MSSTPIARCKPYMLKCVLVSIALWSSVTWAQSEETDRKLLHELNAIVTLEQELESERLHIDELTETLSHNLNKLTGEDRYATVAADQLRHARLELEALKARLATLDGLIARGEEELKRLALAYDGEPEDDSLPARLIRAREKLQDTLRGLYDSGERRLEVALAQLRIYQSRVRLDDIDEVGMATDPRKELIQGVIVSLIRDSARMANQATEVTGRDPWRSSMMRLLELESDDAMMRANLRQVDLQLLRLEGQLDVYATLLEDRAMPTRILRDVVRRVDEAENLLVKRTATLSEARALLASRKDLLEQQEQIEQFVERQDQVVRDLLQLVEFQERDVEKLTNRVNLTQEQARQAIEQSYRSSLLSRHPFSANQFGLDHGFRDLLDVPRQATDWVSSSLEEVWDRLRLAEPLHWLMIAVCIVILLAGATGLARLLDWVLPANIARHWEVACVAVRPLIWWLVPLGAWLVMIGVLDLGSELGPPIFITLLAIPVTRFLLRTARTMLTGMAGERPEGRAAVAYGQFRLAIYLGVLAVVMGGLVRWVEISPAVGDLFNLVSMLALLGTAVLTLRVRKSLPDLDMPITGRDRPAEFALYVMSVAAITISVIGLTGYTDLAWLILFHLGWLVLVITLAWMAIQVVRRTARKLQSRLDFSGLDSVFWLRSLVVPAALIVQAVIVLAGLVALYMGFQWELPSPFANWLMTVTGLRDVDVAAFLETETGHLVRRAVIEIGIALLLAYVVWELARRTIDRYMPEDGDGPLLPEGEQGGTGATRISTLMPVLRKFLLIVVTSITVMVVLSSLGINIGPLLAGAGVVGIAIGFGAQTLIKDIISGVLFLVDDAFRKGEYVDVGTVKGAVEDIRLTSLKLRHHNGPIHTIAHGSIQSLTNYSRDWAIMKFEIRVPFEADVEKVRKIIKRVGQEMLEDEELKDMMLGPLKSQGVNRMDDSALIIRCKFTARPGQQFMVRRVAFTRIQQAFEENGIQFAPRRVIVESALPAEVAGAVASTLDKEEDGGGGTAGKDRM